MIEIKKYDLPDAPLLESSRSDDMLMVWTPPFFCIVLGQSGKPVEALHVETIKKDRIPVYKRPSGGETVLLSTNTLVISRLKRNEPLRSPKLYFNRYNEKIIAALSGLGVQNLSRQGISDICIESKKILGSSIYRNKDTLLYHAVLNISEAAANMEKYLKHPAREPGYRQGRPHRDFVTSLAEQGYDFTAGLIKSAILNAWKEA